MRRGARHILSGLLLAVLSVTLPAGAQSVETAPRLAIVVLDRDALYARSQFGQRIQREIEAASQALATENRRIEAALIAEEQVLTDQRALMDPAVFGELADEFDSRVEEIRQAQVIKGRVLTQQAEQSSELFFQIAGPVLTDLAQRSGALVVLDRRTVLAAADQVDITLRAIAEVDRVVGEGPGLEAMLDAQIQVPTPRPEALERPANLPPRNPAQETTGDNPVESPRIIE